MDVTRRSFLSVSAAAMVGSILLPRRSAAVAHGLTAYGLTAAPVSLPVVPGQPDTALWGYNGGFPGPLLRVKQGERLRAVLCNDLPQDSSLHWHGIRLPNAMDGVPGLTQPPVRPGESFVYEFDCRDAGTYWYHPHWASAEQIGRGLYGLLIVDEASPPPVDRDVAWVLSDLRLDNQAQVTGDFRHPMDLSHAGRLGNTALLNGRLAEAFAVMPGERLRLRLLNAANARIFNLRFAGHAPWLMALDGHPVMPRRLETDEALSLGPGMRADLILDAVAVAGQRHAVTDTNPRGEVYRLFDLAYQDDPVQGRPAARWRGDPPLALPANPVAEPDLARAERLALKLEGGAMGALTALQVDGREVGLREAFQRHRVAWALNGQAHIGAFPGGGHAGHGAPLFSLSLGKSYILEVSNETAWPHPMHLHGHAFRVLDAPGRPLRDTVLLEPRGRTELAFMADNPGDWMLHCHILEHQAAGMMATVRIG